MNHNNHWKNIKEGYSVRPANMDDAESAAELFNECSMDMMGVQNYSVQEIILDWQTPGFDLAKDSRVIFGPLGELVGFVAVWSNSSLPINPIIWGRVRPVYENLGIGTEMFEWSIDRARDVFARVPQNARVALNAYTVSSHAPSKKLLEDHGLRLFRHSWEMVLDLNGDVPEPEWPEGISLRAYDHDVHGPAVYKADYEAFRDHFGFIEEPFEEGYKKWLHQMIEDEHYDPTLWFVAFDGDEIVGGSICRPESWEDADTGWFRTLFVLRPWRRRGLALALLYHSFAELKRVGKHRVGLGVDAENRTGATELYKKAGMRIKRQYDRYELELRPGDELSTQ